MYIFFPLTSLTVHVFSTIMSISMPAEGAEPTEKCKKSCKAGEILTSVKHFPMLVTLICILFFFLSSIGKVCQHVEVLYYSPAQVQVQRIYWRCQIKDTPVMPWGHFPDRESVWSWVALLPREHLTPHTLFGEPGEENTSALSKCALKLQRRAMRRCITRKGQNLLNI